MKTYTYAEIASNYNLWQEYVDPSGLDSEENFDSMPIQEKIDFQIQCFGPEDPDKG